MLMNNLLVKTYNLYDYVVDTLLFISIFVYFIFNKKRAFSVVALTKNNLLFNVEG